MGNRVTLTIQSTAGELTEQFSVNQPIHALKREVMARLALDPSQANSYRLVHDSRELGEDETLEGLGIPDGATLLLVLVGAVVV